MKVEKGFNVEVVQAWEDAINLSLYKPEDFQFDILTKRFPIILHASTHSPISLISKESEIIENKNLESTNCQITYLSIVQKEGKAAAQVLQQKVMYKGVPYLIHDIFGVESSSGQEPCVICMAEPRNVVVLPCRHMCLCIACADIYRVKSNKCPICRAPLRSLIKVNDDKSEEESDVVLNLSESSPQNNNSNSNEPNFL